MAYHEQASNYLKGTMARFSTIPNPSTLKACPALAFAAKDLVDEERQLIQAAFALHRGMAERNALAAAKAEEAFQWYLERADESPN